jgi:hypothetical protein
LKSIANFKLKSKKNLLFIGQSKMGNTLGVASDIAVDSLAEIREKAQEQKYETEINKYNQQLNHLSSLSEKYLKSTQTFTNKFIVKGSTIFKKVQNKDFSLLILYNIENNSINVIHMKETNWEICYKSPVKENEFFTYKSGEEGVYYFRSVAQVTPDEDMRICCEKHLKTKHFSSVSYFNIEWIRILDVKSSDIYKLVQRDEKLYVFSSHSDFVIDIQKNEILEEFSFSQLSQRLRMTDHYVYFQNLGFGMIQNDSKSRKIIIPSHFDSISKNEEFILFFDSSKMIGYIHPMTEWRENILEKKIESTSISFSLLDVYDFLEFSEDSEFVYMLRIGISLMVFSIREKKFVFKLDLPPSTFHTQQIQLLNDFVLLLGSENHLIYAMEIKISPRLKPYMIHTPANIQFKFK